MLTQDQIRLVSTLVISIPLSFFLRFIKPTNYRYLYSIILSLILQFYVFSTNMIWLHIQSLIVFALIKILKGKRIGAIITLQSMIFLSCYHIKGLIYNYGGWTMDAQALLMILVCKYSLLAYSLQDGFTSDQKLTQQQRQYKLTQQISFYDYIGFLNFLPTAVIGPPIEYNDYKKFMQLQKPYDNIPETIKETLIVLGHAVLCAAINMTGEILVPTSYMKTDQFFNRNALFIIFYSGVSITFFRFKYYFGWKISIASVHASGVSYNGNNFKLINTCSPYVVETDKHIRSKIAHWNTAVQEWLRKCVYQRSPFKSRGVSQLYVFMISAFWHGFYAGYYFSFFLWFVQVYTQGEVFKFVKLQTSRLKTFYRKLGKVGNILVTLLVNLIFSHNAVFFVLLDHNLCFKLLQRVNYVPQTILLTLAVTFTLLNMLRSKKTRKSSISKNKQQKDQQDKTIKQQVKAAKVQ